MNLFDSPEFFLGANLPWLHYGIDFGASAWTPKGGAANAQETAEIDAAFAKLAASGIRAVRWFLFCDGRAGIDFGPHGRPEGLDQCVFRDLDAGLAAARRHDIRVMFVLLDFVWCDPARIVKGVQLGGRSAILQDLQARRALLANVIRPVVTHYGSDPSILAWDIINEPEWIRTLTSDQLYDFIKEAVSIVHANATQPVTVGSAGMRWRTFYQGLDLDFYQVHWYDGLTGQPALETPLTQLAFDRPVLLGEFPTQGSTREMHAILDTAHAAGYAGAFFWSALADDRATDAEAAIEAARRWLA